MFANTRQWCEHPNDEEMSKLTARVAELEKEVSIHCRDCDFNHTKFRLQIIASDDAKVAFYMGFPSHAHLMAALIFGGQQLLICCIETQREFYIRVTREGLIRCPQWMTFCSPAS